MGIFDLLRVRTCPTADHVCTPFDRVAKEVVGNPGSDVDRYGKVGVFGTLEAGPCLHDAGQLGHFVWLETELEGGHVDISVHGDDRECGTHAGVGIVIGQAEYMIRGRTICSIGH